MTLVYPLMVEDPAQNDAIVVDVGAHYFEEVSQDFGNWAFIVMQDIIFNTQAGYDDAADSEVEDGVDGVDGEEGAEGTEAGEEETAEDAVDGSAEETSAE